MTRRSTSLLVVAVLCAAACSEDDGRRRRGDGGGIEGDGGGGNGDGGSVQRGCSADLQSVVDGNGNVVAQCPPDQGCYGGACIAACEAAAASKGNVGCSFVAATPAFHTLIPPPCFAVFLANNWSRAVGITVSRGGMSYDATQFARIASASGGNPSAWPQLPSTGLPPGEVAVLFLSSDPSSANLGYPLKCPVNQAVPGGTAVMGTGKGSAFTIVTDAPVSAYDILPYGGATSFLPAAEMLLPTSAWGTNYVAALPPAAGGSNGPQWGQIVAVEDTTKVTINPVVSLPAGGGVPAAPAGQVTTFVLNAGEYAQWLDSKEMSGSVISSDKPVSFVGGTGYLCITSQTSPEGGGCDSGHQMIPPVSALGSEYVATPFVTRRKSLLAESVPYRFVGAVDGTQLTYDPAVPGAPTQLGRGLVVDFEAQKPFVVRSQDAMHPFYVAQMMPGALVSDGSRPGATTMVFGQGGQLGDEEFVNVLPPAQFLSKYVYFTDPSYSTTNLVLTRVKRAGKFEDVDVDCSGTVTGWMPIGSGDQYEYAHIDLVRAKIGVGSCSNGPHVAQSAGPFGLVVWGTDTFSSYAYPGGGNAGTISNVVITP